MWKNTLVFLIVLGIVIPDFCSLGIDTEVLTQLSSDEVQVSLSNPSFLPSNAEAGGNASYIFSFSIQSPLDPSQRYALLLTFRAESTSDTYNFLQNAPYALCWLLNASFQTTRNSSFSLYDNFVSRTSISCYNVNQTQSLLIYLPQALKSTSLTIQIDKLLNPAR